MSFVLPPLYPILDAAYLPADSSERAALLRSLPKRLADAGVTLLQYRNKTSGEEQILSDALLLRRHAPPSLRLIMNDHAALAVRAAFDGLHLGQDDMPSTQARSILGPDRILGLSTHNPAQLSAADSAPADYVAIGPVFATSSKQNPDPVIGLAGVRAARAHTARPLVAIGGITLETAALVRAAGADSIAVISAIFAGPTPEDQVPRFLAVCS